MNVEKTFKVLYYARVSTLHDEQAESLENQKALCESYLKRHPELQLAESIDSYVEKVSGKSDEREGFQKLMERISRGDIDYLLVKDLKRLSRSTEVSAQIRNMAKIYKFKIILLATSQVYDPNASDTRMLYGFESLVNEEYVFRQSEYGRIAHKQKCEAKRLNRNNVTFGYCWNSELKDIDVNELEADVVRTIFDKYVFQNMGIQDLRKYLASLDMYYSAPTITRWLQESAYIGIFHINKKGSELGVGSGQKTKRFVNPKEEWIAVERPDLAIVDREIFDLAQQIRESRRKFYKVDKNGISQSRFKGKYLFSGKVICAECGFSYVHGYADRKENVGIYRDIFSSRNKNALEKCSNIDYKRIYEDDLIRIALTCINGIIQENKQCFELLQDVLEEVMLEENLAGRHIQSKEKELRRYTQKVEKIMESYIDAPASMKAGLAEKYDQMSQQMEKLKEEISQIKNSSQNADAIESQIEQIKCCIQKYEDQEITTLDRMTVDNFIKKIEVHKDGQIDVLMNTDSVRSFTLPDKGKNRRGQNGPFCFCTAGIEYQYSREQYLDGVRSAVKEILCLHGEFTRITLFSYFLQENAAGRKRQVSKRSFIILVDISLRRS